MSTLNFCVKPTAWLAASVLGLAVAPAAAESPLQLSQAGSETGQSGQSGMSGQSGRGGQKSAQQGQKGAGQTTAGHPVVYMLVPVVVAEREPAMKKGCWARFHDDQNFGGDTLTLVGPVDMPNMTGPFGIDWQGKISSVETGPKARVQVYDNENYQDLVTTFKPGQKVPDVSKTMGFFDQFRSLKIACS